MSDMRNRIMAECYRFDENFPVPAEHHFRVEDRWNGGFCARWVNTDGTLGEILNVTFDGKTIKLPKGVIDLNCVKNRIARSDPAMMEGAPAGIVVIGMAFQQQFDKEARDMIKEHDLVGVEPDVTESYGRRFVRVKNDHRGRVNALSNSLRRR